MNQRPDRESSEDRDAGSTGSGAADDGRSWRARARSRLWIAGPVVVGVLPFLVVTAVALRNIHRPGISQGDYAFIEMWTRSAMHGDALLGPYSRYRWNHPGPALFYWYAPFFRAFGQAPESIGFGAAVFNTLAAAVAITTSGVASGRRAAWVTALGIVALVWIWGFSFIDRIWNPFVVMTAIVATGFLLAGVLSGRRWLTPVLVAFATFIVQSHVGTAPLMGLFALAAAVGIALSVRVNRRTWVRPLIVSGGVAVVGWALPLYEQLTGHPGNIGEILQFTRSAEADHGAREVLDILTVQYTLGKVGLISNVVSATRPIPDASAGRLVLLALLLAAVVAGVPLNRRAGRRFEQHLCLAALLGVVGVTLATFRVVGELEGYLTLPAMSVGALLWSAAGLTAAGEISNLLRSVRVPYGRWIGPAVAVVASLWLTNMIRVDQPSRSLQVPARLNPAAVSIRDGLLQAIPESDGPVLLVPGDGGMAVNAMVANQLELGGHDVRVDPSFDDFFGRDRRSDGCERWAVRVGTPGELAPPDQGQVIGGFADRAIQVRELAPPSRCG